MEAELVTRLQIPFKTIPAAGLHGVGLRAFPANLRKLLAGYRAARKIVREYQPESILYTGGYLAVPMAFAASGVPAVAYVPDIEPALALQVIAKFVKRVAVTTRESRHFFGNKATLTGYPTRQTLQQMDKKRALVELSLSKDYPVLLIIGGSKGARSINEAVISTLTELLDFTQIIHVTGSTDWERVRSATAGLSPQLQARYRPFAYLHEEISVAFSAADLVLARGGASTLGELPLFGLPAVLVPYPHAWRYQQTNAGYLARNGAAIVLADNCLATDLVSAIRSILDHPYRRADMSAAMRKLSTPEAASSIATMVLNPGAQPA